jgi:hypothetical protein
MKVLNWIDPWKLPLFLCICLVAVVFLGALVGFWAWWLGIPLK